MRELISFKSLEHLGDWCSSEFSIAIIVNGIIVIGFLDHISIDSAIESQHSHGADKRDLMKFANHELEPWSLQR